MGSSGVINMDEFEYRGWHVEQFEHTTYDLVGPTGIEIFYSAFKTGRATMSTNRYTGENDLHAEFEIKAMIDGEISREALNKLRGVMT